MVYASKSEANYARYLDALLKAKKITSWEGQVRVPLVVYGKKICVMVPDFLVMHIDGRQEYREIKGFWTPVYKIKLKIFEACFPEAWYTIVPAKVALAL